MLLLSLIVFLAATSVHNVNPEQHNKLLVILFDALRWDYLKYSSSSRGFGRFIAEGVKAEYMSPVFPTESYPNYYAIMTGLYPESHHILFNYMYDKSEKTYFEMLPAKTSEHPYWWNGSEPLWITATLNNITTASLNWPGGNFPHNGITPNFSTPFTHSDSPIPLELRDNLKEAIKLLASDKVQYAQVYTEYTDYFAHILGPFIMQNFLIPFYVEPIIEELLQDIKRNHLEDSLNVVMLSDHGMTATDMLQSKAIYVSDIVSADDVDFILDRGSHTSVYPADGQLEKVYKAFKKVKGLTVYKTNEIPNEFHINYPDRIPPIFVQVKKGYYLIPLADDKKQIGTDILEKLKIQKMGYHGYIGENFPDMWGSFMARGPAFKKGVNVPHFQTIDAYNMLAHLTGVTPHPNNGTWDLVKTILK